MPEEIPAMRYFKPKPKDTNDHEEPYSDVSFV